MGARPPRRRKRPARRRRLLRAALITGAAGALFAAGFVFRMAISANSISSRSAAPAHSVLQGREASGERVVNSKEAKVHAEASPGDLDSTTPEEVLDSASREALSRIIRERSR